MVADLNSFNFLGLMYDALTRHHCILYILRFQFITEKCQKTQELLTLFSIGLFGSKCMAHKNFEF